VSETEDEVLREEDESDDGILVVRRGPGANCSSIGSAVEMLFLSATVGAAVLAAVVAALRPRATEAVDAHGAEPPPPTARPQSKREDDPSEAG
jgi:hypothetical protein